MKLLRNNKGLSLVEVLIALGISSAAAVAWMNHMQNVTRDEVRTTVRAAINQLSSQAYDYLRNSEVCNTNISNAFGGIKLVGTEVNGSSSYSSLKNKGYVDTNGNLINKDVFKVGDLYENGKIMISNVSYQLDSLGPITASSSPWTQSGNLKITVEFEYCRDYGLVATKNQNGVITARCPASDLVKVPKQYERIAAFRTDASGNILSVPVQKQVMDPNTGQFVWQTTGSKYSLSCGDSLDDMSKEYTDLKACVTEMKMYLLGGKTGTLSCGIDIKSYPQTVSYTSAGTRSIPKIWSFRPNAITVEVLGAGGGGGGTNTSGDNQSGGGGKNGTFFSFEASELSNCSITIGTGGAPGDKNQDGKAGGNSSISCSSGVYKTIAGGAGGKEGGHGEENCGEKGYDSVNPATGIVLGVGSNGDCRTSKNYTVAGPGAGGGGGGEKNNHWGKKGGNGFIKIMYDKVVVTDPAGVLAQVGDNVANYNN